MSTRSTRIALPLLVLWLIARPAQASPIEDVDRICTTDISDEPSGLTHSEPSEVVDCLLDVLAPPPASATASGCVRTSQCTVKPALRYLASVDEVPDTGLGRLVEFREASRKRGQYDDRFYQRWFIRALVNLGVRVEGRARTAEQRALVDALSVYLDRDCLERRRRKPTSCPEEPGYPANDLTGELAGKAFAGGMFAPHLAPLVKARFDDTLRRKVLQALTRLAEIPPPIDATTREDLVADLITVFADPDEAWKTRREALQTLTVLGWRGGPSEDFGRRKLIARLADEGERAEIRHEAARAALAGIERVDPDELSSELELLGLLLALDDGDGPGELALQTLERVDAVPGGRPGLVALIRAQLDRAEPSPELRAKLEQIASAHEPVKTSPIIHKKKTTPINPKEKITPTELKKRWKRNRDNEREREPESPGEPTTRLDELVKFIKTHAAWLIPLASVLALLLPLLVLYAFYPPGIQWLDRKIGAWFPKTRLGRLRGDNFFRKALFDSDRVRERWVRDAYKRNLDAVRRQALLGPDDGIQKFPNMSFARQRRDVLATPEQLVERVLAIREPERIIVHGNAMTGKSQLARAVGRLLVEHRRCVVIHIDLHVDDGDWGAPVQHDEFYKRVLDVLEEVDPYTGSPNREFVHALIRGGQIVLIFDGVEGRQGELIEAVATTPEEPLPKLLIFARRKFGDKLADRSVRITEIGKDRCAEFDVSPEHLVERLGVDTAPVGLVASLRGGAAPDWEAYLTALARPLPASMRRRVRAQLLELAWLLAQPDHAPTTLERWSVLHERHWAIDASLLEDGGPPFRWRFSPLHEYLRVEYLRAALDADSVDPSVESFVLGLLRTEPIHSQKLLEALEAGPLTDRARGRLKTWREQIAAEAEKKPERDETS